MENFVINGRSIYVHFTEYSGEQNDKTFQSVFLSVRGQRQFSYLVVTSSPWDALFLFLSLRLSHRRRSIEASKAKKVSFVAAAVAAAVVAVVVVVAAVDAAQQDLPEKKVN